MGISDNVPQTMRQAHDQGWQFLSIRCLSCHHTGTIKIADYAVDRPLTGLADIAKRSVCRECQGRVAQYFLGYYDGATHKTRPIVFEGSRAKAHTR